MHPPGADTVLIRYGAVNTKSDSVKERMLDRLKEHVEALLADRECPGTVTREPGRLFVRTDPDSVAQAADTAAMAFGVVSTSPARATEPTLSAIESALAETSGAVYNTGETRADPREMDSDPGELEYNGGTYAVRAHRSCRDHPFDSRDIEQAGGAAVADGAPAAATPSVDLDDPDITFGVELRREEAYVYTDRIDGPGGLPANTQEPVVALVSGGIDSPVAAYEMMTRGVPVIPVYIDLGDYGGADHRERATQTVRDLARHDPTRDWTLHVVAGGETVETIVGTLETGRMLALRRYFFRVAEAIASEVDATGIVTGESLGQKSSQTATNLQATSEVTDLPIHRPLLSVDKTTIEQRARAIGTYTDSTIPAGCNRVAPQNPATRASRTEIRDREPADISTLAATDAAAAQRISLSRNSQSNEAITSANE